ncbi:DNA primase [Alkalilacustris brevis]|uniref:DNA primase n=1 Tax=Alkalilacustris brevis TaxID=2026338 RepID=UPI000E0D92D1|nr:DNA primase [Alkalilacustris brevis]
MSLPPGFLEELRDRVPLSRLAGSKVTWDRRKSNPAKGDMWAPCPFHQEKTASFHVDDRKGFYYCFGCQAKGDAISFLREADNLSFMEAVEMLAREAGMQMPARDPKAAERADRRATLAEVMEKAVRFYRMQLATAAASEAREYLARRGLDSAACERFEIGFAPDGRQALWSHLTGGGAEPAQLLATGLAGQSDDGGTPYDRFRARIVFPIRDARGRCIGFGGRALRDGPWPKYLNSPETELFDKGRTLYNHGPARSAVAKGQPLIVAEGYMDVIALARAGFEGAVAPLGTAITEEQLRMMWRIAPEPIIALDGDKAGLRAGLRLADLALPMIEAGQSLRFAILPEGQDPDDLLRAGGAAAMQRVLDQAMPMVRLLWQRETEGQVLDSPERRAALDKRLRESLRLIRDPSIRAHYADAIRALRADLFGQQRSTRTYPRSAAGRAWHRTGQPSAAPLPSTRGTLLAGARDEMVEDRLREAIILAVLISHPRLLPEFMTAFETLELSSPEHGTLRTAVLRHYAEGDTAGTLRDKIAADAGEALEKLFSLSHVTTAPPVRNTGDVELAKLCLAEELAKLEARRGARREISEAMEDIGSMADESLTWRLSQAAAARDKAARTGLDDSSDLGEDRAALSQQLQRLIDGEVWVRKKR